MLFRKMTGVEELGRPFQYELVLLSEEHDLDYKAIIGQNVTISVGKGKQEARFFNGVISRFAQTNYERRLAEYRATMVPWLWFLTRSSDCRIFQGLKVPEILKQVFQDHGFSDVIDRMHGTYQPWEYCVQYRESAFSFVSRLMEQEGIYYFFKHENGKHSLVLCDTVGSHLEFKGYEQLKFHLGTGETPSYETVWKWVEQHEVQAGAYSVREFDFKHPRNSSAGQAFQDRQHAGSQFEQFDYLGEMDAESDRERYSKFRLEQLQARHELYTGEGDARGICTGVRFHLKGHPRKDFEKEYLTVASEFRIESDPFETVQDANNNFVYEAKLTALPVASQFRSLPTTHKPTIQGPQTAIVVGPAGEEIHTDKFGRVKVQFHWDRYGKADENSSCWVRVAQRIAGRQWGTIALPRIGQEVVVEFLDGNPDRPIITGGVYNQMALPPYDLPENKTVSSDKSNSSKGGQGFNEIRFEDKKDSEQVFVHAEKDLDVRVKHDAKAWVGNEQHLVVKKDQFANVEGNSNRNVKGNSLEKTTGDRGETVSGARLVEVDGKDNLTVKDDHLVKVDGDVHLKFGKNLNQDVSQKISINAGTNLHEKAGQNYAMESGLEIHLKAGTNLILESGATISLKAGPSFVTLGASGVAISGPMIMLNSGGAALSGAGSSPTAPTTAEPPDPPKAAADAADAEPGQVDDPPPAPAPPNPKTYSSAAKVLFSAAEDGTPFCEECAQAPGEDTTKKTTWIEIRLVGEDGKPIPDERYRIKLPDGSIEEGNLDDEGKGRVEGFEKGDCKISFPDLDQDAWEEA